MVDINRIIDDALRGILQGEDGNHLDMDLLAAQWNSAIRAADEIKMRDFLERELSPDFPAGLSPSHPIAKILMLDYPAEHLSKRMRCVSILLEYGAELRVPDAIGMIPADYAMLSRNYSATYIVVIETIRQLHEHGNRDYIPDISGFFATCTNNLVRSTRYSNLIDNHERLRRYLENETQRNSESDLYGILSDRASRYWLNPLILEFSNLPTPSKAFLKAQKAEHPNLTRLDEGRAVRGIPKNIPHDEQEFMIISRTLLERTRCANDRPRMKFE